MLVSSVGYFNPNRQSVAERAENNKIGTKSVVTQGLIEKNNEAGTDTSIPQYLKNAAKIFENVFLQDSKTAKNSLDMIA